MNKFLFIMKKILKRFVINNFCNGRTPNVGVQQVSKDVEKFVVPKVQDDDLVIAMTSEGHTSPPINDNTLENE